ncbi:MAG: FAD-dependent oxidoreductase [Anaerolineae bacterium]|nr:FAD-dependent oxidoreductase [Anaerolineae bacterium]
MSNQEDILIIGGGVIGVCTAYYLARQGQPVTLVEKDDLCAGSSYGNAGWIANGHAIPIPAPGVLTQGLKWLLDAGSPFYIKPRLDLDLLRWLWQFQAACNQTQMVRAIPVLLALNQTSLELFEQLVAEENLKFGYERPGLLHLFKNQDQFKQGVEEAALLRKFGVETVMLDSAGIRQMEPNVSPSVTNGIYYPNYAHMIPDRFVRELARLAERRGACIKIGTEVLGFETSGRRISAVATTRGRFEPEQVVLATGAWSPDVARSLKLRLPIQPAKGYSLTFKRPPTSPSLPLSLPEYKVAVTPMGEQLRLSSTLELAGLDPAINQRRLAAIRQAAYEYLLAAGKLELIEIWRGFRPLTPDDLPIIGRSEALENLILATGHGMLGMTQGPITGKLVSQIIAGEPPVIDLAPLRVERFSS